MLCAPHSGSKALIKNVGGRFPPYDAEQYKSKLEHSGEYICEGNLLWVGDMCSGVPVRNSAVQDCINLLFPDGPAPLTEMTIIAVPSLSFDPMKHLGALRAVSPEEDRLVVFKAVVRDIDDPAKMQMWAGYLCTAPLKFELLPNQLDRHFRDVALREQVVGRFNLVARTTYGRMLEVWNFKVEIEKDQGRTNNTKLAER